MPGNKLSLGFAVLVAAVCSPPAAAQDPLVTRGRALFQQGCISCHGHTAEGVQPSGPARGANGIRGAGPSLVGVGALAADLYLSAGYMPLRNPWRQPLRREPQFSPDDIRALVAYIGSLGGPPIPHPHPERGSLPEGLRLYTANCAGCHQMNGQGGLVTGAIAPELKSATPTQIAEAVRAGPFYMPRFGKDAISDRELDSIIRYVELTKDPVDRGGWAIGHLGPIPEGLVAWLLAGTVLLVLARIIGERRKE